METTKKPRARRWVTVNTEVEVDIGDYLTEADNDELGDLGLHRADDCSGDPHGAEGELYAALQALHGQAHPDQQPSVDMCLLEPCRSLSLRRYPQLAAAL